MNLVAAITAYERQREYAEGWVDYLVATYPEILSIESEVGILALEPEREDAA